MKQKTIVEHVSYEGHLVNGFRKVVEAFSQIELTLLLLGNDVKGIKRKTTFRREDGKLHGLLSGYQEGINTALYEVHFHQEEPLSTPKHLYLEEKDLAYCSFGEHPY